ncbi:hypothetical protein ABEB36_001630 [Hypothenemus hampei]|uniref:Cap-specific mRNA (nucleoside-2'-O-)-methyltransferase 2 n=1 Tax=Hypothenemus hampei TaxID=57062 RepID=A0ABD1FF71_HYPHA
MINDVRLINSTEEHWLFGADLTGNIMEYYNCVDILNKFTAEGKANLITADGSINCMKDPGEQEKLVEFLQYCETMTALAGLIAGGTFIIKIFTIFEKSTVCLVYLLNCLFNRTVLFKPATSKSGNSELYLICLGYKGFNCLDGLWDSLLVPYKNGCFSAHLSMFSLDEIPHSFLIQLKSCCQDFFLDKQIQTIKENIYFYLNPNEKEEKRLQKSKVEVMKLYLQWCNLKQIPCHRKLILPSSNSNKLLSMRTGFQEIHFEDFNFLQYIHMSYGKRFDQIKTSRFASLDKLNDLMEYLKKSTGPSPLNNILVNKLAKTTTIINVHSLGLHPYWHYQQHILSVIHAALKSRKHLMFINVPFHTHFLAALWCLLCESYEKVYFRNGCSFFYEFHKAKGKAVRDVFQRIQDTHIKAACDLYQRDLISIFRPHVFWNELSIVHEILKICNDFSI